ncbi:hypothetical protein AZE42_10966 [Rhizopogon vesiculosus]|uniref:Uncharacterized protein n=1 Tax=Rhizopogon vesiculosus TaxID=180088 RepID=A0A1J8PT31_9AGAM|nr:hypothetical protein AZE42_10966 [Rhizopogon vesiculosus]
MSADVKSGGSCGMGRSISQVVVNGVEAYWFRVKDGDTMHTNYGSKHTWVFQPVPDISTT